MTPLLAHPLDPVPLTHRHTPPRIAPAPTFSIYLLPVPGHVPFPSLTANWDGASHPPHPHRDKPSHPRHDTRPIRSRPIPRYLCAQRHDTPQSGPRGTRRPSSVTTHRRGAPPRKGRSPPCLSPPFNRGRPRSPPAPRSSWPSTSRA